MLFVPRLPWQQYLFIFVQHAALTPMFLTVFAYFLTFWLWIAYFRIYLFVFWPTVTSWMLLNEKVQNTYLKPLDVMKYIELIDREVER